MPSGVLGASVAMTTYNGERFLDCQLESIAAQTVHPTELVLCDDCSTDQTIAIATKFAERAPFPVRIFRNNSNVGFTRNFRKAAEKCSGDLIAFCDQDDWWHPTRLEVCISRFRDPDVQLFYHNAWVVDERGDKLGLLYDRRSEATATDPARPFPFHASYGLTQIFRSNLRRFDDMWSQSLNHVGTKPDILAHDQWYFFLAQTLGKVVFEDVRLVEYRQHDSNLVGASWVRPTLRKRFLGRIGHRGRDDARRAAGARSRATILRMMQERECSLKARLDTRARLYDLLARRLERRASTYSDTGLGRRFRHLIESWRKGDYSDWPWGFDSRSVIRDFFSGVLLAKL
jgi:Glycosyltransferases involved in cell wall biogenesis